MNKFRLKSISLSIIGLIATVLFLNACQKPKAIEPKPPQPKSEPEQVAQQTDSSATVGHNPYSVKTMRKAWIGLQAKRKSDGDSSEMFLGSELEIQTSHLYLRFKPKDEAELSLLEQDTTLELFGYPIDNESVSDSIRQLFDESKVYRDEGVPADQPPYQYCAVPLGASLPQVDYEILDSLFIPDEELSALEIDVETGDIPGMSEALDEEDSLILDLVRESLIITDNLDTNLEKVSRRCGWYIPRGRIRVWDGSVDSMNTTRSVFVRNVRYRECYEVDDGSGGGTPPMRQICTEHVRSIYRSEKVRVPVSGTYLPVAGLRVRARRWFITKKGTTDANGYYRCNGRYLRPANYSFKWERYDFSIRAGRFGQARVNGGKRCGSWSYDIGRQGSTEVHDIQQYYALIFQAAHDYYYGGRFGLHSPPRNAFLKKQIKIAAIPNNNKDSNATPWLQSVVTVLLTLPKVGPISLFAVLPTVKIREFREPAQQVYATTIHELAHMAHWDMDRTAFYNLLYDGYIKGSTSHKAVVESWATGVEVIFTNERYRKIGNPNHGYGYQGRSIQENREYTSIVSDMMDDENQRVVDLNGNPRASPRTDLPQDRVSGYTILQIQQGLRGVKAWHQWRTNMRRINNPTSNNIVELFNNWH